MRAVPGARLLNAYGLTETTITSTLYEVGAELLTGRPSASVPVGKAIRHAQVLVLDPDLNQVPAGTVGQVYIGGCGVARGYLGGGTGGRAVPAERPRRLTREQDVSHRRSRALA